MTEGGLLKSSPDLTVPKRCLITFVAHWSDDPKSVSHQDLSLKHLSTLLAFPAFHWSLLLPSDGIYGIYTV